MKRLKVGKESQGGPVDDYVTRNMGSHQGERVANHLGDALGGVDDGGRVGLDALALEAAAAAVQRYQPLLGVGQPARAQRHRIGARTRSRIAVRQYHLVLQRPAAEHGHL